MSLDSGGIMRNPKKSTFSSMAKSDRAIDGDDDDDDEIGIEKGNVVLILPNGRGE